MFFYDYRLAQAPTLTPFGQGLIDMLNSINLIRRQLKFHETDMATAHRHNILNSVCDHHQHSWLFSHCHLINNYYIFRQPNNHTLYSLMHPKIRTCSSFSTFYIRCTQFYFNQNVLIKTSIRSSYR